ncbi:MAG: Alpha/Beta hydrolase protein [Benniella sp.]|nr:MAG: Alpha/Beta hydrolase protein [Benniella sp.]
MQLQLLLPAIFLGLTAAHSAPNIEPVDGKVASRPVAKPIIGNVTTPDGSLLGFHLYNNTKKTGTPVILIGGLFQVQDEWKDVVPYLAKDRPVLTYDHRGIGESSVPNYSLVTMSTMVQDIQLLTQHLGWRRFNLVGISMGAIISQIFAANYTKDLVLEHLVLISSAYKTGNEGPLMTNVTQWINEMSKPPGAEEWQTFQEKLFLACLTPEYIRDHPKRIKVFLEQVRQTGRKRSFDALMAQASAFARYDLTEDLKRINVPTLVLHGGKDGGQPPQNGRDIHALIPGSKYIEYPDGGHILYETIPESLKVIARFLDK